MQKRVSYLRSPTLVLIPILLGMTVAFKEKGPAVACSDDKKKIMCLPDEYSKFDLPFRNDFNVIDIGIEISDVLKIDDKDYSITFSLYFNVQWSEPRLNLSQEFFSSDNITSDEHLVPVNLELIHDLWVPNIFIYNLKTFQVIDVLSKLAGLWINNKKNIYYSQATHITFICPMLFDSFPLDTQVCKFQVGSYSYDMTRMLFRVSHLTFIQKQSIILDYNIQIFKLKEKDKIFLAGPLGNYSLAGFQMNLRRHVMSYIITYYLPSGLFVVVSWISFLIPPDIVPGRMALLITLFLVLINIFNNITTNSPKAEGLTAIEIWMLACILFVFGTLIEYAVILFKKQKMCKFVNMGINGQTSCKSALKVSQRHKRDDMMMMDYMNTGRSTEYYDNFTGELPPPTPTSECYQADQTGPFYKFDPVTSTIQQINCPAQTNTDSIRTTATTVQSSDGFSPRINPRGLPPNQTKAQTPVASRNNGGPLATPTQTPQITRAVLDGASQRAPTEPKGSCEEARQCLISAGSAGSLNNIAATQYKSVGCGPSRTPVSFVYQKNQSRYHPRLMMDSLKRRKRNRRQSILDRHYSTWHDQYAKVDRFFLYFTPFLFLVFNSIYWGYFYVWGLIIKSMEDGENAIEMPRLEPD